MLATLESGTRNAESLNDPQASDKKTVVQKQVSILHNVLRKADAPRRDFRQHVDLMQKMQKLRTVTDHHVSVLLCVDNSHSFITRHNGIGF